MNIVKTYLRAVHRLVDWRVVLKAFLYNCVIPSAASTQSHVFNVNMNVASYIVYFSSFVRQLKEAVEEAGITSDQRARMNEFFNQKALLGSEMNDEDFEKIHELGAGNGGVVSKVRHLKSGIIMARKV